MNRKARREIDKKEKKLQKLYGALQKQMRNIDLQKYVSDADDEDVFREGDLVRLNLERIQAHADYERLQELYKQFVNDNEDRIFKVHLLKDDGSFPAIVTFQEDDTWHFWFGDLIRVKIGG